MREIKFRCWTKEQMLYEGWNENLFCNKENIFRYDDVMQYTGKKDKKDKEIFEGDWCRACFRDKEGFHYKQGKIIMDDYMWCLDTMDGEDEHQIYSINRLHDWEVLGNIYENPELLGNGLHN
jgi:uncharacterized phage protein (TIGR01671 family)